MKIDIDGTLCDQEQAVVSVMDHGFLYGIGLFETFRTYGGRPFLLDEHLRRLRQGCAQLGIPFRPELREVELQVRRLLEANRLEDAYLRYTVSAGVGPLGLPVAEAYDRPRCILYIKPLPEYNREAYEKGKPLRLLRLRRSSPEGDRRMKSFQYMNNILAKRELQTYPESSGAEGLMLNERGEITEGIVSNLFFIRDQACCTPSLDTGILPGITRQFVIGLCRALGLKVNEGIFRWEDVCEAEEAFLTNSIQEIVPVHRLIDPEGGAFVFPNGRPGDITRRLMRAYRSAALEEREPYDRK